MDSGSQYDLKIEYGQIRSKEGSKIKNNSQLVPFWSLWKVASEAVATPFLGLFDMRQSQETSWDRQSYCLWE